MAQLTPYQEHEPNSISIQKTIIRKDLYQEKGKTTKLIKKGDVVKFPPNVVHWHVAMSKDAMTHIAIGTNTQKSSVVWMDYVSDLEYKSLK